MKEGDKRRPGSLQQPSVTPAHPGTKSDLSPERNVRVWPTRTGSKNKAELQVVPRKSQLPRRGHMSGITRPLRWQRTFPER